MIDSCGYVRYSVTRSTYKEMRHPTGSAVSRVCSLFILMCLAAECGLQVLIRDQTKLKPPIHTQYYFQ